MENQKRPKAYLPVEYFGHENEKYVDMLAELIEAKIKFTYSSYIWLDENYIRATVANISFETSPYELVRMRIASVKRFQSMADSNTLEQIGFKRAYSTSNSWSKNMNGHTPVRLIANHLFAAMRLVVDFGTNSGFKIQCPQEEDQNRLDNIVSRHSPERFKNQFDEIQFLRS